MADAKVPDTNGSTGNAKGERDDMMIRVAAALALGSLLFALAGCGNEKYEAKTTGGEAQTGQIQKGVPMSMPKGMPGAENVGK